VQPGFTLRLLTAKLMSFLCHQTRSVVDQQILNWLRCQCESRLLTMGISSSCVSDVGGCGVSAQEVPLEDKE
jgi:hypothetical protein